jgi:GntR family galactonate operon transcriptional repressor
MTAYLHGSDSKTRKRKFGHAAIVELLGIEILSGRRKPGERLPSETEMQKRYGVSRVVTREVMKTLEAKGFINAKKKVGTFVSPAAGWNWLDPDVLAWRVRMGIDVNFLNEMTHVRRAVEPYAAGLAALNRTKADIAELRGILKSMESTTADPSGFAEADLRFHLAVTRASHNPYFESFASLIEAALFAVFSMRAVHRSPEEQHVCYADHAAIAQAIMDKDEQRATASMLQVISGIHTAKKTSFRPMSADAISKFRSSLYRQPVVPAAK